MASCHKPAAPPLSRYLENIVHEKDGQWVNPTGINVAVTKKGSMTKELFPTWCRHLSLIHI